MRYLRDKNGEEDVNFSIPITAKYIKNNSTGEKLFPYVTNGYNRITISINGMYYNQIKMARLNWMARKGLIPKGYHIHHNGKDEYGNYNKLNDHIDCLKCMGNSTHVKLHNYRENNPMYGKCHSEETIEQMSIKKYGENNPMYGRHHSKESKNKIGREGEANSRALLTQKEVNKIKYQFYWLKIKYKQLTKEYGVSRQCISNIINGRRWNPNNLTKDQLIEESRVARI